MVFLDLSVFCVADLTVPIHEQLENAMSRAKRSYNYPGDDIIIDIHEMNSTSPGDDVRYLVGHILRNFNDKQCSDPKWPYQCPSTRCYKYTQKRISQYRYQVRCLADKCESDEHARCVCGGWWKIKTSSELHLIQKNMILIVIWLCN